MQNGYIESSNGKFRDECMKEHRFQTLHEAREAMSSGGMPTTRSGRTAASGASRQFDSRSCITRDPAMQLNTKRSTNLAARTSESLVRRKGAAQPHPPLIRL